MRCLTATVLVGLLLSSWVANAAAASPSPPPDRRLVVGTKHAPPFAIKHPDGTWHGVSIDLWRQVAADLGFRYEFRECDLPSLLTGVQRGTLDVAVAALTVTAEREETMDFTHPLHTTGLGIATVPHRGTAWLGLLERVTSVAFLRVVAALALVLLGVGALTWLFERKKNPQQFGGPGLQGIGAGFWWSAVTMTTVGYGDKAPVTLAGRLVALVWMFAALIVVATFTGAIASALTVGQLEGTVNGPDDLPKVRVGTVAGATSEAYLRGRHLAFQTYEKPLDGLEAVARGEIDALVYDRPLVRYLVAREMRGELSVLPVMFERQDYALALPAGSPLREPINRVLLRTISSPDWRDTLYQYLGE